MIKNIYVYTALFIIVAIQHPEVTLMIDLAIYLNGLVLVTLYTLATTTKGNSKT